MFTKEGAIRWFHDDALLIRDEQGTPMFWQGIMYDITDQRTSDALVRETEDRYRTLVEQLPAIVYSEDVTGDGLQVVYINSRVKELLGIEPEEWVADPSVWAASIHPDDAQMVDDVNRESERLSEPFSVEYRMIARDGRIVWFKDEARLVHHADGTPAYWQGVMIDITDRREAEAQVAEAEARYRALVEQMPSVTYVAALGQGGGVLYISPQIGSMLGYPPQAWYTDPGLWNKLVHPDDADRGHPEPAVGEHNVRYRMIARDGRTVWVHDQARLIVDEDGEPKYWQGVLLDVTQQHRAGELERDLATERMVSERLREADAVKNTFLQAVSHDLRSPLAAILGLARTLERDDLDLPPPKRRTWPAASPPTPGASTASSPTCWTWTASAPGWSSRCSRRSTSGRSCASSSPAPIRSRAAASTWTPPRSRSGPTPPWSNASSRTCSATRSSTRRATRASGCASNVPTTPRS